MVNVVAYDPAWPDRFERLAAPIRDTLAGLPATVVHVGSTAVPGLDAKPIIDIDVVLSDPTVLGTTIARLAGSGYAHAGTNGIAGREAFDPPANLPAHHLYLVVDGSPPHLDHVLFRDLLRDRPELAARYAAVKRASAHLQRVAYQDAKADFIAEMLAVARAGAGLPADPTAVQRDGIIYRWRGPIDDDLIETLHKAAFGRGGYRWRRSRPFSLGWVTAQAGPELVGFVNLSWDGDRHAFLLDLAVAPPAQRRGIGRRLVARAAAEARARECEWLHVDYEPHLATFYAGCGFAASAAGVLRL